MLKATQGQSQLCFGAIKTIFQKRQLPTYSLPSTCSHPCSGLVKERLAAKLSVQKRQQTMIYYILQNTIVSRMLFKRLCNIKNNISHQPTEPSRIPALAEYLPLLEIDEARLRSTFTLDCILDIDKKISEELMEYHL